MSSPARIRWLREQNARKGSTSPRPHASGIPVITGRHYPSARPLWRITTAGLPYTAQCASP